MISCFACYWYQAILGSRYCIKAPSAMRSREKFKCEWEDKEQKIEEIRIENKGW